MKQIISYEVERALAYYQRMAEKGIEKELALRTAVNSFRLPSWDARIVAEIVRG